MGTSTLAPHGKESPGGCDPGACDQWNITPEPRSERLRVWTGCVSRDEGACALSRVLREYAMRPRFQVQLSRHRRDGRRDGPAEYEGSAMCVNL